MISDCASLLHSIKLRCPQIVEKKGSTPKANEGYLGYFFNCLFMGFTVLPVLNPIG